MRRDRVAGRFPGSRRRRRSAAIVSASLLGGKYLALTPGGEDEMLKDGQSITITQSSINLEGLIGQYIFGNGQHGQSNQAQ